MSKASNYLEEATLNYFLRGQSVPQPQSFYVALYITNPTDADTGSEVTGGAYARQQINFSTPVQQADRATISNTERVVFPTATAGWGDVAYFGIRDAATGGRLLVHGAFNKPTTVSEGNKFIVDVGNITISLA